MTLHNGTTRNTTEVLLAGEGAEINLCGMAIADKNQHVDNNTSIDHAVPNCTSNELFKYVLDDQSVGAFAGLVLVRPDAQHTSSQQTVIFAPPVMRGCIHNPSWRFMRTT
jgi:Fe-S cluster assembly protein SufD